MESQDNNIGLKKPKPSDNQNGPSLYLRIPALAANNCARAGVSAWVYEWESDGEVCLVFHDGANDTELARLHQMFHKRVMNRRRENKPDNGRFRRASEKEIAVA
jgi:hypothetical protein